MVKSGMELSFIIKDNAVDQYSKLTESLWHNEGDSEATTVVNYSLQMLYMLEECIERTCGIDDPAEFLKKVRSGEILIINKSVR